ncbi:MAG: DUF2125 domain-containing protein [Rhizobiaceae bacterium]|nr:MAG: DUF2125 domain-containing protein [Rhizobiaceae bacterium]
MTSSEGKRRGRAAFFWLPVTLLVVAGLLTGGWYFAAHLARLRGQAIITQLNAAGKTLDCRNATITGFPIKFGVDCRSVGYEDRKQGISLASGRTHAVIALYSPFRMNVALNGPASIEAEDTRPLALDWEKLDAQLSLGLNDVTGIAVEGKALAIEKGTKPAVGSVLFQLGAANIAAEPSAGDLDLAFTLSNLTFGPAWPVLRGLHPIDATGNIRAFNGAGLLQTGLQSLRNRQFAINALKVEPGPDSSAAVTGNISFDENGLADGRLLVALHDVKALSAILAQAFPREASKIEPAFAMLGTLGNDQTLPVDIRKGRISLGFFKIGRLPPVD